MQSVEESNAISQSTDLDQILARETKNVGSGEATERSNVTGKSVGLQPLDRLLGAGICAQRLQVILEDGIITAANHRSLYDETRSPISLFGCLKDNY